MVTGPHPLYLVKDIALEIFQGLYYLTCFYFLSQSLLAYTHAVISPIETKNENRTLSLTQSQEPPATVSIIYSPFQQISLNKFSIFNFRLLFTLSKLIQSASPIVLPDSIQIACVRVIPNPPPLNPLVLSQSFLNLSAYNASHHLFLLGYFSLLVFRTLSFLSFLPASLAALFHPHLLVPSLSPRLGAPGLILGSLSLSTLHW